MLKSQLMLKQSIEADKFKVLQIEIDSISTKVEENHKTSCGILT